MDSRNVLMAVILSSVVLIFWSVFFEPPTVDKTISKNKTTEIDNSNSPSIEEQEAKIEVSRSESINKTKRIKVENEVIKGSISLEGAIIDDIIFKNYKETLNSENKVVFLNPKNSLKEYFIETGWASGGNEKINLPVDSSIWEVKGNNFLSPNNPITL